MNVSVPVDVNVNESALRPEGSGSVEDEPDVIRRKIPKCPGVYVEGQICGVPTWITVDTGASRTILSESLYRKIPAEKQLNLSSERRVPLEQAGGSPLPEIGSATVEMNLGTLTIDREVVVADIKDEVLLGMDVGDTVDVLTSKRTVVIDGHEVPCCHVKSDWVRKVYASHNYHIPGNTEAIFDATVESISGEDDADIGEVVVEPTPYFGERHALVMAASLVNLTSDGLAKVRIMNPCSKPVTVHRNTVIGYAQPCNEEDVECILDVEDEEEVANGESIRRLKFQERLDTIDCQVSHENKIRTGVSN